MNPKTQGDSCMTESDKFFLKSVRLVIEKPRLARHKELLSDYQMFMRIIDNLTEELRIANNEVSDLRGFCKIVHEFADKVNGGGR